MINTRKAPGFDGIPIEVLLHGDIKLTQEILHFIIWQDASIYQEWVDERLNSLYKGMESKSDCSNQHERCLFQATGETF